MNINIPEVMRRGALCLTAKKLGMSAGARSSLR